MRSATAARLALAKALRRARRVGLLRSVGSKIAHSTERETSICMLQCRKRAAGSAQGADQARWRRPRELNQGEGHLGRATKHVSHDSCKMLRTRELYVLVWKLRIPPLGM